MAAADVDDAIAEGFNVLLRIEAVGAPGLGHLDDVIVYLHRPTLDGAHRISPELLIEVPQVAGSG